MDAIGANLYYAAEWLAAVFIFMLVSIRITELWDKFTKGRNSK